jgi:hypothetical protein
LVKNVEVVKNKSRLLLFDQMGGKDGLELVMDGMSINSTH